MPQLYIGRPLAGNPPFGVAHHSLAIFDQQRLTWSVMAGCTLALCLALLMLLVNPASLPLGSPSWTEIGLAFLVICIGHEALHMLVFPRLGLGQDTIIGLWPQFGSPFVQHLSPMPRNRFLCSAAMPFLVLSLAPIPLVAHDIGPVDLLSWVAVLNGFGAGSDLHIAARVLRVVPADAWVVENGETLLWGRN